MSRFQDHIIMESGKEMTSTGPKAVADYLERNCKKFLKEKPNMKWIYRATYDYFSRESAYIKKTRREREPQGTYERSFVHVNDWLEENGHVRRDKNVVIGTSDKDMAETFGNVYVVLPIGSYHYTWVRSRDFNMDDKRTYWDLHYPDLIAGIQVLGEHIKKGKTIEDLRKIKSISHWIDRIEAVITASKNPSFKRIDNPKGMDIELERFSGDFTRNVVISNSKQIEQLNMIMNSYFTTDKKIDRAMSLGYETWFYVRKYALIIPNGPVHLELMMRGY